MTMRGQKADAVAEMASSGRLASPARSKAAAVEASEPAHCSHEHEEKMGEKRKVSPAQGVIDLSDKAPRTPKRSRSSASASSNSSGSSLPALCDSARLARAIADSPPVSPSSSAQFVRRSVRSKRSLSLAPPNDMSESSLGKASPLLMAALRTSFPALGSARLALVRDPLKGMCVSATSFIPEGAFVVEYAGDLLTEAEADGAETRYAALGPEVGCFMFYFKHRRKTMCIDATAPGPGKEPGSNLEQHLRADAGNNSAAEAASSSTAASSTHATAAASSTAAPSSPGHSRIALTGSGPAPTRLEALGYGFARYINHSRAANLTVKLFDVPSDQIKTSRFDGSRSDEALAPGSLPFNPRRTYPRLLFFANRAITADEELTIDYGDRDSIADFPWLA